MRRRFLAAALPLLALAACQTPGQAPAMRTVVYFTADSAALDENASALVEEVAERAKADPVPAGPGARLRGAGAGTVAFNRTWPRRGPSMSPITWPNRVDRRRIRIESRGAVPFEMMATESRRVEIVLGD